ncbi:hypothetical protein FHX74_000150 [Friedmanniella endophytica]|uniref:Uncharacterized protein n=1 Tax=Microlunatus kandeliicorticis TaxID=1759536 RepID=A0A7W3P465_9ACTN|nr:hypothetical protein [Microlunatus kandeliicorticis]MBA8792556.1 hypothetical protein [Microlunatus kandeliicorticis]
MTSASRPDPLPGDGDALTAFILAQSAEGVAVPVLLFGPDPADAEDAGGHEESDGGAAALADRLGYDLATVSLHTSEAYVLQCGLGQALLDRHLAAPDAEVVR